jgi:hypothetical protein
LNTYCGRECPNVKTIWLLVKEWLDSINIKIPSIIIKTAILGDNIQSKAVNHIILITKYYIYLSTRGPRAWRSADTSDSRQNWEQIGKC